MFKQLYLLTKQLLTLTEDTQKNKADIKELRQELKELTEVVRQLKFEAQRDRENAAHDLLIGEMDIFRSNSRPDRRPYQFVFCYC